MTMTKHLFVTHCERDHSNHWCKECISPTTQRRHGASLSDASGFDIKTASHTLVMRTRLN